VASSKSNRLSTTSWPQFIPNHPDKLVLYYNPPSRVGQGWVIRKLKNPALLSVLPIAEVINGVPLAVTGDRRTATGIMRKVPGLEVVDQIYLSLESVGVPREMWPLLSIGERQSRSEKLVG
jgi:hypothetical protein